MTRPTDALPAERSGSPQPGLSDARVQRIVYLGPSAAAFAALKRALEGVSGCRAGDADSARFELACGELRTSWELQRDTDHLLEALQTTYVNLLVIDLRCATDEGCLDARADEMIGLVDRLDELPDIETRFGFHRIVALLPAADPVAVDRLILALGRRGIGAVLRQPQASPATGGEPGAHSEPSAGQLELARLLLAETHRVLTAPRRDQRALCAAGGGITGIYFEMGALKCLDDCLGGHGVNDFDLYFGISAGAVVTGLIAAGYSIDEFMASVAGVEGGRLEPIDMRLFRLSHLDYPALGRRVWRGVQLGAAALRKLVPFAGGPSFESLFFDSAELMVPPFRADGFEKLIRRALGAPGATNDFRLLPRPLFIGVTDQDEREHVIFGAAGYDDVPISVAIRASLSLNPAFGATRIGGRYYEDGGVTRTSNFVEAIRRGAGLIFVLDPFVPYVSRAPGFASTRGMLFNFDQNIRTISYTRFENTRGWVLRRYPDVRSYTFLPANRLRQLMSVSPFDHRPFLEIWRGAYLSTLQRIQRLRHRMHGDLASYGVGLELGRAEAVAERLETARRLELADFYPEGRVEIRQPPLCLERAAVAARGAVDPRPKRAAGE